MSRRSVYIFCLLYCIAVYELPCILTLAQTGWDPLPPVLVADQMLYLILSAGETESEQRPRQAMYLMMTGVDSPSFTHLTEANSRNHPCFAEDALSRWALIQDTFQDDQIKLYIEVPKLDDEDEASH